MLFNDKLKIKIDNILELENKIMENKPILFSVIINYMIVLKIKEVVKTISIHGSELVIYIHLGVFQIKDPFLYLPYIENQLYTYYN